MDNYDIYQFFISTLEAPKDCPMCFNYEALYTTDHRGVIVIKKFLHRSSMQIHTPHQLYAKYEHE